MLVSSWLFLTAIRRSSRLYLECSECKGAKEIPDDALSTFAEAVEREHKKRRQK